MTIFESFTYLILNNMRKFYLLLVVALLATSSAFADITYELNGGQPNPYGWNTKEDMYNDFMKVSGAAGYLTLAEYCAMEKKEVGSGVNGMVGRFYDSTGNETKIKAAMTNPMFTWLAPYLKSVETKLTLKDNFADSPTTYKFAACAFFISGESTHKNYPSSNYAEAGKDEAYFPTWGYSYGNPSIIEGEYTLKNPYREGAWEFAGWYKNAECTGEPITTINADFAGTLYAKWKYVREGITYDLNGGSFINNNPYGWKSKDDMLQAFLTDGSANECTLTIADFQNMKGTTESKDGLNNNGLCKYLTSAVANAAYANTEKWGWLVNYVKKVFADA